MMKNKTILFLVLLLPLKFYAQSQDTSGYSSNKIRAVNAVFVEYLGIAQYGSLNYDRIIFGNKKISVSERAGLFLYGQMKYPGTKTKFVFEQWTLPLISNLNIASKNLKSHIEIGLGPEIMANNNYHFGTTIKSNWYYNIVMGLNISYRYQDVKPGPFFRISFTPLITKKFLLDNNNSNFVFGNFQFAPLIGISTGYTFNKKQKK